MSLINKIKDFFYDEEEIEYSELSYSKYKNNEQGSKQRKKEENNER